MLFWLAAAVAIGGGTGAITGGKLVGLARWHVDGLGFALGALVAQLALPALPSAARSPVLIASLAGLGCWFAANASVPGWLRAGLGALAVGVALNAVAIAANGAMPVSRTALKAAGLPATIAQSAANHSKHQVSGAHTRVMWLGDNIPVPQLRAVISLGDIAMLVGIAIIVAAAMQPGPRSLVGAAVLAPSSAAGLPWMTTQTSPSAENGGAFSEPEAAES